MLKLSIALPYSTAIQREGLELPIAEVMIKGPGAIR